MHGEAVKSLNYINHDVNDVRSPHIFPEGKNNCLTKLHDSLSTYEICGNYRKWTGGKNMYDSVVEALNSTRELILFVRGMG